MSHAAAATHRHHRAMGKLALAASLSIIAAAITVAAPGDSATAPAMQPGTTRPAKPDYSVYTKSYHVPFTRRLNFDALANMHVRVSLNGGRPTTFLVDTGSVGIIVADDEVPNMKTDGMPGSITYISSGIEHIGTWTTTEVTFVDSDDGQGNKAVAIVPILAVNRTVRHAGTVNGPATVPASQPTTRSRPHMFGMGFGRGRESHQERNPFVNLVEMQNGTMRRGYTITRDGYTLGLTNESVGEGYYYESLRERSPSTEMATMRPGLRDWESSRGWVTVGGIDEPNAAMLLDTGLTNFMIGRPGATVEQEDVPDGTPVTVHLLSGQLEYKFEVRSTTRPATPVTPRRVTFVKRDNASVNTGLRALANFDYLYDADGGYFGLRPTRENVTTRPATRRASATTR